MAALKLYTKDSCPGCQQAKRLLKFLEVEYEERRVDQVPDYLSRVVNLGFRSLPVAEVEGVGVAPGADSSQLEQLLVRAGLA
jgi:glutaredoxin